MRVDNSAVAGAFLGSGDGTGQCTVEVAGLATTAVSENGELAAALISLEGISGPTALVTCAFEALGVVNLDDFVVTVESVTAPDLEPVALTGDDFSLTMTGCDEVCGNGIVDGDEECDDAGVSATCDADCTLAVCGDGTINRPAGEQCDDAGESENCNIDCTEPRCGDKVVNHSRGEDCDEGRHIKNKHGRFCQPGCRPTPCGRPAHSQGARPNATDALYTLGSAVAAHFCDIRICDVDDSGLIASTDALRILYVAVGRQDIELRCPSKRPEGQEYDEDEDEDTTTTSSTSTTSLPTTTESTSTSSSTSITLPENSSSTTSTTVPEVDEDDEDEDE